MYCFMAADRARLFVLRKGKQRMLLVILLISM